MDILDANEPEQSQPPNTHVLPLWAQVVGGAWLLACVLWYVRSAAEAFVTRR